ncbi:MULTISPECIES: SecY-interacting protein Syd [unclassified Marinobacterium]|nr:MULTISPECIES: SecY-interacting protein Syd [unclassified Marinobacterium]
MSAVTAQLTRLFDEFKTECKQQGNPTLLVEEDWLSPALLPGYEVDQESEWLPSPINNSTLDMFERLSEALEIEIPQSIIDYYTSCWSQPILATHTEGELSLIFVWNPEDLERLRENLIGHALNKRRLRQNISFFFATTEPDGDQILSVESDTGRVLLEKPGQKKFSVIAEDLESFLSQVTCIHHQ